MPALRELPPQEARLCLQIEKIARQLGVQSGQLLLLAVSGGSDSAALLAIFNVIAPRLQVRLSALHVDHQLRPESGREAQDAMRLCQKLGIDCSLARENIGRLARQMQSGIEEAGRAARRRILTARATEIGADFILTGHQAEDLAEDIMLRLLRGAGWPALGGMAERNDIWLRPLLRVQPGRLRDFLRCLGLKWSNDESNQNLAFRRNRIRHLLMPLLRCENPAISASMLRLHELAAIDADYWEAELVRALAVHPWQVEMAEGRIILSRGLLRSVHKATRLRLYMRALAKLRPFAGGQARADNLLRLDDAWVAGVGGKTIQCGGGISAVVRENAIMFSLPAGA